MIPVKVQCACGQRYAFDVEPVNGRMPYPVACPVCNADGTASANAIIAQALGASAATAAPAATLRATITPPAAAGQSAGATPRRDQPVRSIRRESAADTWKWWYFVLAGVCIAGYSIWQAYDRHSIRPLGELFFAALCIAIGIWDFKAKRKKKLQQQ